jgi:hypothetical protein
LSGQEGLKLLAGVLGGFNWSSQHLSLRRCLWDDQRGGCTS